MPNYCYNTLTLVGKNSSLNTFWKANCDESRKSLLSFQKSVPVQEGDTCEDKWNTKWEARFVEFSENVPIMNNLAEDIVTIKYMFSSAWSPPTSWLDEVIKIYTDINFILEYEESGCDFGGIVESQNGIIVNTNNYELSEYNWNLVNKNKLDIILAKHIGSINEYNIDDYIDTIMEDISVVHDKYYENIQPFLQEKIEQLLNI